MFERLPSNWMIALKKVGYWIWLIPVAGIPMSYYWSLGSDHPNAWPWLVITIVFGVIPFLDFIVGRDPANPDESDDVPFMEGQGYYRFLSLMTLPLLLLMLAWSGWVFVHHPDWNWVGKLGWVLSVGTVMGAIGITVSHELIHKDPLLEQSAGGILLAAVCYAGFKVEHVRGHHVNVSTPEDASSARFGQSLYQFLPHAYKHNFLNAWNLEAQRLKRKGLPALHWRNELVWWYALSAAMLVGFTLALGWLGGCSSWCRRRWPLHCWRSSTTWSTTACTAANWTTAAMNAPVRRIPGTATSCSPTCSSSTCSAIRTTTPTPSAATRCCAISTTARSCPTAMPG